MNISDQVLYFPNRIVIRKALNGIVLTVKPNAADGDINQIIINETAVLLLQEISGRRSLDRVTDEFCRKYKQDITTTKDWIKDFIEEMFEFGILSNVPPVANCDLTVVNAEKTISPANVSLEVTSACNMSCPFCYARAGERIVHFPFNSLAKVLDELFDVGVLSVGLTGGEFFVHSRALDILKLTCDRFPRVSLLTNGTLITDEAIDYIGEHSDQILVGVSIDSATPTFHDTLRNLKGAHEKACQSIRRLAERGVKVRMSSVICEENQWEITDLAELALSLGATSFAFSFVENFGRRQEFNDSHSIEATEDYGNYITNIITKYREYIPLVQPSDYREGRMNCGAGTGSIVIGADGNVRPCLMMDDTKLFGNIINQSLEEVLSSPMTLEWLKLPEPSEEHGCSSDCYNLRYCKRCVIRGFSKGTSPSDGSCDYCDWIEGNNIQHLANEFSSNSPSSVCEPICEA